MIMVPYGCPGPSLQLTGQADFWHPSAPRARRARSPGRRSCSMRCCVEDEGFVALRRRPAGGGVKPPHAALAEDRRGERWGKGAPDASGGDQEGERERTAVEVSKPDQTASKLGRLGLLQDEPGGCPCIGQAVPGMEAARAWSAAFTRNVGRRTLILPAGPCGREVRGSAPSGRNRKALSTVAASAGGPARSSGEALV